MIDPIEVVVAYLKTLAVGTTVGGRVVGGQAPYGKAGGWTLGQTGIAVQPSPGGAIERAVEVVNQRVAVRLWAATEREAWALWLALHEGAARTGRQLVAVSGARTALLHALLEDSGPSLVWDDELGQWSVVVFYLATVAETVVS
jgi:hypothetical protein